jgi:hypothetical protein
MWGRYFRTLAAFLAGSPLYRASARPFGLSRSGTSGASLLHSASDTVHDLICAIVTISDPKQDRLSSEIDGIAKGEVTENRTFLQLLQKPLQWQKAGQPFRAGLHVSPLE